MSDIDRRGPVDLRLIRLVPAVRSHLIVIAGVAAATAIAVVVQAEVLANGLTDLVADDEIADGLAGLILVLASVAVVRMLATAVTEWSAARAMTALRRDVGVAVLDHATLDGDRAVSEEYRATTMGALRIAFLSALALELIATLSVALIAVEIGLRLASGRLDLATALVVLLLTPECYLPLRRVGAKFHAAQSDLDEPTADLDVVNATLILDTVLDRCADRTTILLRHSSSVPDESPAPDFGANVSA